MREPSMTQNNGPYGSDCRSSDHGVTCSQPQSSMPISRRRPPLPRRMTIEPSRVQVMLGQQQRLVDAQAGTPEHDDQPA